MWTVSTNIGFNGLLNVSVENQMRPVNKNAKRFQNGIRKHMIASALSDSFRNAGNG
jgi:hypothetical protein